MRLLILKNIRKPNESVSQISTWPQKPAKNASAGARNSSCHTRATQSNCVMFAGSCLFWVEEMLNDYTNVIALFSLFAKSDKQKSLQFSSLQMYHLYHMYHVFSSAWRGVMASVVLIASTSSLPRNWAMASYTKHHNTCRVSMVGLSRVSESL